MVGKSQGVEKIGFKNGAGGGSNFEKSEKGSPYYNGNGIFPTYSKPSFFMKGNLKKWGKKSAFFDIEKAFFLYGRFGKDFKIHSLLPTFLILPSKQIF